MAVETLNGVPCSFEGGNTVIFSEVFTDFPPSAWSATFYLSRNGTAVANAVASESGEEYIFTLSAASTASLTPGLCDFAIYVLETATSQRTTAKTGQILILPNLAATQTATTAQTMVTNLESALQTFATSDKLSVSFNGQSFTRANIADYRKELVFWKAQVIAEQARFASARGEMTQTSYSPRFNG
jgi:hypothetical protein